jgi:Na+-driven multidrug efflux pump
MQKQIIYNDTKLELIKQILHYAVPICTTNILGIAASFITTIFLAKLGKIELAALAIANTCYITLSAFVGTCLYSVNILVRQNRISGNKQAAACIAWNGIFMVLL